jgi:sugar phosphate isomerase/epimerase
MTERLALSTMYFQRWVDQRDLAPFFDLGREIGFERFELSHILTPATVAAVDPRRVTIAAVHHPCPLPPGYNPSDQLTSADPQARQRAAAGLRATVETAARLGAPAVVVHLGAVEDSPEHTGRRLRFELESRYLAGQYAVGHSGMAAYSAAMDRLNDFLADREAAHIDRAIDALPPLLSLAQGHGVRIGLETGYHSHELPSPAGMRRLLDALDDPACGAWLDTGHVGAQANLGRVGWDDWFDAVGGRWIGVHLHDIIGLRDHLVPGMGALDFAALAWRVPADVIRTCEIDWYFAPDELRVGLDHLRATGWTEGA